jgi:hypothetical protein
MRGIACPENPEGPGGVAPLAHPEPGEPGSIPARYGFISITTLAIPSACSGYNPASSPQAE